MSFAMTASFPNRLRGALHLLHRLQKERGASCVNCAFILNRQAIEDGFVENVVQDLSWSEHKIEKQTEHYSDSPDRFDGPILETAMYKARSATDASFRIFLESCGSNYADCVRFMETLNSIREQVSKCVTDTASCDGTFVNAHDLIKMFNSLISEILDEAFESIILQQQKIVRDKIDPSVFTTGHTRQRCVSDQTPRLVKLFHGNSDAAKSSHRRSSSLKAEWIGNQIIPVPVHSLKSSTNSDCNESKPTTDQISRPNEPSHVIEQREDISESVEISLSSSISIRSLIEQKNDQENVILMNVYNLLTLLLFFSRLKESSGVIRAYISSLMVFGIEDQEQENKLFSDLVIRNENQREIIRQIQKQTKTSFSTKSQHPLTSNFKSLTVMINKYVQPNKEMQQIQDKIDAFDLRGLQRLMPMTHFWRILSLYMDQLHSIELLIVEELQGFWVQSQMFSQTSTLPTEQVFSAGSGHQTNEDILKNIVRNLFVDTRSGMDKVTLENLRTQLSSISGDDIKKMILGGLEENVTGLETNVVDSKSEEEEEEEEEEKPIPFTPPEDFKEWNIDFYEIEFSKRIGRGVAGTTYLATWGGQKVAVKVAAVTDLGLDGWETEIKSLQRLHHPNIIRLLGSIYNSSPETYGTVLEFCDAGDLNLALTKKTPPSFFWRVAEDVANGMAYLHRKNVLHRDIKPANILLNGDVSKGEFVAKLTDFGLAIMPRDDSNEELTAETGTYRWMAPEVIRHEYYSFMADVFSYGVVLWQLVTHEIPFQNISQIEAAGMVARDHARPPFPKGIPKSIEVLIETCWDQDSSARMPFSEISSRLKDISKALSEKDKAWLKSPDGHNVYSHHSVFSRKLHIGKKFRRQSLNLGRD